MVSVPEIFVKMVVGFAEDPKVVALNQYGDDAGLARDLYLAMCRYCRRNLTDGFVPGYEVGRLAWPLDMQHAQQLAMQLASVELTTEVATGWIVVAYVKRNGTRAEAEELSTTRRASARRRWNGAGHDPADANSNASSNAKREQDSAVWSASRYAESESESKTSRPRTRAPARPREAPRGTATPPPVSDVLARSRRTEPSADPSAWAAKARAGLPSHEPTPTDSVTNADDHLVPGPDGDALPAAQVDDPEAADDDLF